MNKPLFMGIDGGGSTLRIVIVDAQLQELASLRSDSVNPSIIGRAIARERIRGGILKALQLGELRGDRITAVGIGIAGASNCHSEAWLRETLRPSLPTTYAALSSDLEIALVGALAQPSGILLLAGTGSAAYGCTAAGQRLQVGGWGYLLGDEGSSYWIGSQLLRHVTHAFDAGAEPGNTALAAACLDRLGLPGPRDLLAWVYRSQMAPAARVASLAPFLLDRAEMGDELAIDIARRAAEHLVQLVETVQRQLNYSQAPIAFAGGLLDNCNWLSAEVARRLSRPRRPAAKHSPVIGAALLAKLEWSALCKP